MGDVAMLRLYAVTGEVPDDPEILKMPLILDQEYQN